MHYVAWRIESLAWLETCFGEDNLTTLYLVGTTVNKVMYIIFAFLACYNVYIILTENCLFILMLVHAENKELLFCPPCWCIVDLVLCCFLHNVQSGSLWVMPASSNKQALEQSDQVGEVCWGGTACTCVPQMWARTCMQATSYINPFLDL